MTISNEQVERFQKLYFENFGEHLTKAEASEKAYKLVRFIQLIYRPMTYERFLLLKEYIEKTEDIKSST